MKVELTVVGIRNYCEGGEDGLPKLFERLPLGSELFMRINPTGTAFPGAVSVIDGLGNMIGSISKTDRRYIELAIPKDGMLPCMVVDHSLKDVCLYVEAENNAGIKDPYIRQVVPEQGEMTFDTTEHDKQLHLKSGLLLTLLKKDNPNIMQVKELARDYARICCTSLDAETSFSRADILYYLKKLNASCHELDDVIQKIFEQHKDIGRRNNDVKVKVYREQYERIRNAAYATHDGRESQLDCYMKSLAFIKGDKLQDDVIKAEVNRLSELLSKELMNTYIKVIDSDEDFATALYSLNYSLRAIYVLYTRRIKREFLMNYNQKGFAPEKNGTTLTLSLSEISDSERISKAIHATNTKFKLKKKEYSLFYLVIKAVIDHKCTIKQTRIYIRNAGVAEVPSEGSLKALTTNKNYPNWKISGAGIKEQERYDEIAKFFLESYKSMKN